MFMFRGGAFICIYLYNIAPENRLESFNYTLGIKYTSFE